MGSSLTCDCNNHEQQQRVVNMQLSLCWSAASCTLAAAALLVNMPRPYHNCAQDLRTSVRALSAGLVGRAIVAFQSVGWFGYNNFPESARPWQNHILYDWSARCPINIQDNWACGILYAIVGYQVCCFTAMTFLCWANIKCSVAWQSTAYIGGLSVS